MPNLSVLLSSQISITDTTLAPSPTIITRSLNNPTLAANTCFYDPFFQTINGTAAVNLPATPIYVLYVKNLSAAGNITLNYTPNGGASTSVVLQPGGLFLYFQPAETAGGITAVTLTATAVLSCEVLVAE